MMRDKTYQAHQLGPDVMAYLAWKRCREPPSARSTSTSATYGSSAWRPSTAAPRASPTAT